MGDVRSVRTVSVIVPHYDDPRLPSCLEALAALEVPSGWRVERIVVDNDSRESPQSLVEASCGVTLLQEPRRGSYAARNTGLASASGEVVAFTDSDCRPDADWLVVALRRLDEDSQLAAVAGRVRTVFETGRPTSAVGWWEAIEAFPQERYVSNGYGVTANLVVRREAGDSVGWFDREAQSGGDADFGRRLTAAGLMIGYEAGAVVSHPARTTWHELFAKGCRTAMGHARMDVARGAGARDIALSVYSLALQLLSVLRRGLTRPELVGPSARIQYLTVGLAFRVFWFVERYRRYVCLRRRIARGQPL